MKYLWLVFPAIIGACLASAEVDIRSFEYWLILISCAITTAFAMEK